MTTTTKRKDFLGRWLKNAQPGTTAATDYIGRAVISGPKDYLGRSLAFDNPAAWDTGQSITAGDVRKPKTGTNYDLVVVALDGGTTSGSTEPTWPTTVGATVVDNPGPNAVTWQCVHG